MKKLLVLFAVLSFLLLSPAFQLPASAAPPPIQRPMGFIEERVEGDGPWSVDYSAAYDTASCELIQNMMDTLIVFNGEHADQYLPSIATSWTNTSLGNGVDSGLPVAGLNFENPQYQPGPNATYYHSYDFKIRPGVVFQPPYNYSLTPADVAFSFQRTMIMDVLGGPHWMLQEPLLDNSAGDDALYGGIANLSNTTQVQELGALIENAVQFNSTDAWFNMMFPFAYNPFIQVLCQTWSSIESKQWIDNYVCTDPARAPYEWDGNWPNTTAWLAYRSPTVDRMPLDQPTPLMYGSGPFVVNTIDYNVDFWAASRNAGYWRGWPADYPAVSGTTPAGYVNTIYVTWAFTWPTRLAEITSGAADFVAVPRKYLDDMYKGGNPANYPLDGVRCIEPLPTLTVDALFFTLNINPATDLGQIGQPGVFGANLIPSDFFGNTNWGLKMRTAFAQAFDYNTFLTQAFLGEAIQPATAIIPGLNYHDPSVAGWSYNLAAANASLNQVGPDGNGKMLKDVGFSLDIACLFGSAETACSVLKTGIESLNPRFHVNVIVASLQALFGGRGVQQKLPMFAVGSSASFFPDPHELTTTFYHSTGAFPSWQNYNNATMDTLIKDGISTQDGPDRQSWYTAIQSLAVSDVPDFAVDQPVGRYFERDWVNGWYYNPAYLGFRFYGMWKWYYVPASLSDTSKNPPDVPPQSAGFNLPWT